MTTPEQTRARAEARAMAERRVADATTRLEFGQRNGFSAEKMQEYGAALEKAEAALWPWQELDRLTEVLKRYYHLNEST